MGSFDAVGGRSLDGVELQFGGNGGIPLLPSCGSWNQLRTKRNIQRELEAFASRRLRGREDVYESSIPTVTHLAGLR